MLRERWSLSIVGKLLLAIALVTLAYACVQNIYPFLAITERVSSDVLVVDGWLPTYQLEQAAAEFTRGRYSEVLAVRAVYEFDSTDLDEPRSDYVADILREHGVPKEHLNSVLFRGSRRDRTFYSALAVGEWSRMHGQRITGLNLVTDGPHARRSRLLYEMALGKGVPIGVIGLDDPAYDARHWWRSSEGVREVLFEGIAYLYVRLTFSQPHPPSVHLLGKTRRDSDQSFPASHIITDLS